jgi:four helix bundle protein
MSGYRDLEVYQEAYALSVEIHKLSLTFPPYERYELGSNMRRASKSVPLNIAEGYGRKTYKNDFIRFLTIAFASADETRVCLDLAFDCGYVDSEKHQQYSDRYASLGRRINRLIFSQKDNRATRNLGDGEVLQE